MGYLSTVLFSRNKRRNDKVGDSDSQVKLYPLDSTKYTWCYRDALLEVTKDEIGS